MQTQGQQVAAVEKTTSLADEIIGVLSAHGIKCIFGYPGAAILPLLEAVRRSGIKWVLTRNETAAALAASAHAKLTGELGVCFATSGPGALNLITGLVDAQSDGASVLAITGQIPTWRQGRSEFQDVDSARILGDALPYSVQCEHPDQLPPMLRDCIRMSEQMHCVVHMSVAADVQKFSPAPSDTRFPLHIQKQQRAEQPPAEKTIDEVCAELDEAGEIVIAVGPRAYGAGREIEALAEKLNAPIITSFAGKGVIDEHHRCSLGVLGIFGAPGEEMAQKVVSQADTVIAFGLSELAPFLCGADGVQKRALYELEPYFRAVSHKFLRKRTLVSDLSKLGETIASKVTKRNSHRLLEDAVLMREEFEREWQAKSVDGCMHQAPFFAALSKQIGDDAVIALDIGDNAVWAAQFLKLNGSQRVLVSENLGVMGFALPAAIAAKLEHPNKRVVAIAGDGGFQMTMHELGTAAEEQLEMVIIVLANGVLGRIRAEQKEPFGTAVANPDFEALARAYRCGAATIKSQNDVIAVLQQAFSHKGSPFLISVHCDPNVLAPMSKWQDGFTPVHFS